MRHLCWKVWVLALVLRTLHCMRSSRTADTQGVECKPLITLACSTPRFGRGSARWWAVGMGPSLCPCSWADGSCKWVLVSPWRVNTDQRKLKKSSFSPGWGWHLKGRKVFLSKVMGTLIPVTLLTLSQTHTHQGQLLDDKEKGKKHLKKDLKCNDKGLWGLILHKPCC